MRLPIRGEAERAAAAYGRAGRKRAIEAFSWEAIAARTVEVYRAALAAG